MGPRFTCDRCGESKNPEHGCWEAPDGGSLCSPCMDEVEADLDADPALSPQSEDLKS